MRDQIGIWSVGCCGGRKTGEPGEKPLEQGREPTTNSIHIWRRVRESNPRHINGRRALSPLRHPCSLCLILMYLWVGGVAEFICKIFPLLLVQVLQRKQKGESSGKEKKNAVFIRNNCFLHLCVNIDWNKPNLQFAVEKVEYKQLIESKNNLSTKLH